MPPNCSYCSKSYSPARVPLPACPAVDFYPPPTKKLPLSYYHQAFPLNFRVIIFPNLPILTSLKNSIIQRLSISKKSRKRPVKTLDITTDRIKIMMRVVFRVTVCASKACGRQGDVCRIFFGKRTTSLRLDALSTRRVPVGSTATLASMHHGRNRLTLGIDNSGGHELRMGILERLGFLCSSRILSAGRISCQMASPARGVGIWMVEFRGFSPTCVE